MNSLPRNPVRRHDFRFELHPYDFSCIPALFQAVEESRERIFPWMGWLHSGYHLRDTEEWIAHAIDAWDEQSAFEFLIYDRTDGAITGACGLNEINKKDLVCNLGYWVRTSKTRLGAATQSVALLQDMAFGIVGLNRLEILIGDGNNASRAVAQRAGAIYEGLQRSRIRVREDVHDAHMYALLRPTPS
jgi:ribosomal-protein-serine acetyltransferase